LTEIFIYHLKKVNIYHSTKDFEHIERFAEQAYEFKCNYMTKRIL